SAFAQNIESRRGSAASNVIWNCMPTSKGRLGETYTRWRGINIGRQNAGPASSASGPLGAFEEIPQQRTGRLGPADAVLDEYPDGQVTLDPDDPGVRGQVRVPVLSRTSLGQDLLSGQVGEK